MKRIFLFALTLSFLFANLTSEVTSEKEFILSSSKNENSGKITKYRITEVTYNLKGITKKSYIIRKVPIDKKKLFNTEELYEYIKDIKQQLLNTRAFEEAEVNFAIKDEPIAEDEVSKTFGAELEIKTKDSFHFILIPYPKYDSNKGLEIKLKMQDTNFFGTMEKFSSDLNMRIDQKSEEEKAAFAFAFNVDYKFPFKIKKIESSWDNNAGISYTIGEKEPEWHLSTGLSFAFPLGNSAMKLEVAQIAKRELKWDKFDDGLYFTQKAKLSYPFVLHRLLNWGDITYTPFTEVEYNWDFGGINENNTALHSPVTKVGHKISTQRINWIDNFRRGAVFELTNDYTYNFKKRTFSVSVANEIKLYKAFSHLAFTFRSYSFLAMNETKNISPLLRGIRSNSMTKNGKNATETSSAIVLSFDMPIKLFALHWENVPGARKVKFSKYFNFEMQLSPFIDIALIQNEVQNSILYFKDGFLTCGVELLVYPLKWRGIQLRASCGFDMAKIPIAKKLLDSSWRNLSKSYEISIGIGLHY